VVEVAFQIGYEQEVERSVFLIAKAELDVIEARLGVPIAARSTSSPPSTSIA
jgi:hypothetical protein